MCATENPLSGAAVPLSDLLGRLGRDVAAAQSALDEDARARAVRCPDERPVVAPIAFFYPEISVDLAVAFDLAPGRGSRALVVAPASPAEAALFGAGGFGGRVCVRIAALHPIAPPAHREEDDDR